MLTKFLPVFLIVFLSASVILAQNEDSTDNDWDWDEFQSEIELWDSDHSSPTITVNYGTSKIGIKGFSGSFKDANLPELKLGHTIEKPFNDIEGISRYSYRYTYLTNFNTDLFNNSNSLPGGLETSIWRFGFGRSSGYGYNFGNSAITPYYTYSFGWSRVNIKDAPSDPAVKMKTDLYNETFRFGTGAEGGIRFKILPILTLEAGYERSVIFQRHLFWKWAGSVLIEAAGQWMLDSFIDEVIDSSPYAGPVVNFVLKNALAYGIYELRQDKMNWPFSSEAPLALDHFKFGVTFNF